jgi:hypothetical protein
MCPALYVTVSHKKDGQIVQLWLWVTVKTDQLLLWVTINTSCAALRVTLKRLNSPALGMSHTKDRLQLCESLKTDQLCTSYCESHYRQTNHATYAVSHTRQTIASYCESRYSDFNNQIFKARIMKQNWMQGTVVVLQCAAAATLTLALPLHAYCAVPCLYNRICQTEYQTNAVHVQHLSPESTLSLKCDMV